MVRNILGMLAGGDSVEDVLLAYPSLTAEDVASALQYAAWVIDDEQVIPRAS